MLRTSFDVNGPLAVDFFFALSGFVIAFSYENRLTEAMSFGDFAVARWIRLYPVYALGSLMGLTFGIAISHFKFHSGWSWSSWSHWRSLSMLALFVWPTRLSPTLDSFNYPLNIPSWSLFYEIAANLAYGMLVKLRLARTSVVLCIVAVSMAVLVRVVATGGQLDLGAKQDSFYLGFARVTFSFFVGVLLCRAYRFRPKRVQPGGSHLLPPVIITMALVAILAAPFSWMHAKIFQLIGILACFPPMVYFGALAHLPLKWTRISTALGELSYPLYLVHLPIITLMIGLHIQNFVPRQIVLRQVCIFGILLALAVTAWQIGEHIDLPIRRALTRRYNTFKQTQRTPTAPRAPIQEAPSAQHHDA
ncbi:MAG: acyltransferase family protein [Acidobacteriaceae bacterium]